MKPRPCFEVDQQLVEAANEAEERKNRAIAALMEKLSISDTDSFGWAVNDLIDADRHALQERGP